MSFDGKAAAFTAKFLVMAVAAIFIAKISADFVFSAVFSATNAETIGYDIRLKELRANRLAAASLLDPKGGAIKLAFVGDIMLDRGVKESIIKNGQGDFRFPFWRALNELQSYDILFGNLEGPISGKGEDQNSVYSFRMDPASAAAIKFAGFDILSLANNHIGDWGGEAIRDTVNYLDREGIAHVGAGSDPYSPAFIEIYGTQFAFLAFTNVGVKHDDVAFISKNDDAIFQNALKKASATADIVIVYFHFGTEYQVEPGADEVELARKAVDLGADLVVGSHAHVVQRVEGYNGGYIAYSLGNFVFDQDFAPLTMRGMLLEANIQNGRILNVNERPVTINRYFQSIVE